MFSLFAIHEAGACWYSSYSDEYSIIFPFSKAPLISSLNIRSAFRLNQSHKTLKSISTLYIFTSLLEVKMQAELLLVSLDLHCIEWLIDWGKWCWRCYCILTFPHCNSVCSMLSSTLFSFHLSITRRLKINIFSCFVNHQKT